MQLIIVRSLPYFSNPNVAFYTILLEIANNDFKKVQHVYVSCILINQTHFPVRCYIHFIGLFHLFIGQIETFIGLIRKDIGQSVPFIGQTPKQA